MLIGYVRVSKSDGTQTLAPQRDAMLAAGIDPTRIYEDLASGRHDARPGLTACLRPVRLSGTENRHKTIQKSHAEVGFLSGLRPPFITVSVHRADPSMSAKLRRLWSPRSPSVISRSLLSKWKYRAS